MSVASPPTTTNPQGRVLYRVNGRGVTFRGLKGRVRTIKAGLRGAPFAFLENAAICTGSAEAIPVPAVAKNHLEMAAQDLQAVYGDRFQAWLKTRITREFRRRLDQMEGGAW